VLGGIRVLRRGKSQECIHVCELQIERVRTRARRVVSESVPQWKGNRKREEPKKNVRRTNQSIAPPLGRDRRT
jgi:hypothetical protein